MKKNKNSIKNQLNSNELNSISGGAGNKNKHDDDCDGGNLRFDDKKDISKDGKIYRRLVCKCGILMRRIQV